MKSDYVIVGAGVSGISAALILSKMGHSVTLVEKSHKTAPVIRGFKRKGTLFETGMHYLGAFGEGEPLDLYFRYFGISDKIQKVPFDVNGFDLVRSGQPEWDFLYPSGWQRLIEKFSEAFPDERACINTYFGDVKRIYEKLPFRRPGMELGIEYLMENIEGPSLKDYLNKLSNNEQLKCLLSAHTILYGSTPDKVPLSFHARIVGSYYESASAIAGGGLFLAELFDEALEKAGVEVLCRREVEEYVLDSEGLISQLRLSDGESIETKNVLHSLHLSKLLDFLPESCFRKSYIKKINALEETLSAYIFFGVCDEAIEKLDKRNFIFFPEGRMDYAYEHEKIKQRHLFVARGHPRPDETDKGRGFTAICPASYKETWQWKSTRLGKRQADYKENKAQIFEDFGAHLQESCGDILGSFKMLDGSTPLSMRDWSNSPTGALYGSMRQVGAADFSSRTRVKNLFLTGQSVVAPGVMGAALSAFITCSTILGHETIDKELNKCR